MLPEGMGRPGRQGYAVCVGNEKPKRGCEWKVLAIVANQEVALDMRSKLDAKGGCAVVRLNYARLVVLDLAGNTVQDNEAEDSLLE